MKKALLFILKAFTGVVAGIVIFNLILFSQYAVSNYIYELNANNNNTLAKQTANNSADKTRNTHQDSRCSWATSKMQRKTCQGGQFKYMEGKIDTLYKLALQRKGSDAALISAQEKWHLRRNNCHTTTCIMQLYGSRLRELNAMVNGQLSCSIDGVPLIIYRDGFTDAINNREPEHYYTQTGPAVEKVLYFTEILGGRGSRAYHTWYKNGVEVAQIKFDIKGDRWRVWSSKRIDDHTSKWEVRTETESGCVLTSEKLPTAGFTAMRDSAIRGGWYKPDHFFDKVIANKDDQKLSFFDALEKAPSDLRSYLRRRTRWGDTPLLLAVRVNNVNAVKRLLRMGASPLVWDAQEKSALQLATELNHMAIRDMLKRATAKRIPSWSIPYSVVSYQRTSRPERKTNIASDFSSPLYCVSRTYGLKGHKVRHDWVSGYDSDNTTHQSSTFKVESDAEEVISEFVPPEGKAMWSVHIYVDGKHVSRKSFATDPQPHKYKKLSRKFEANTSGAVSSLAQAWAPIEMIAHMHEMGTKRRPGTYAKITEEAVSSGNISLIKYLASEGFLFNNSPVKHDFLHQAITNKQHRVLLYLLSLGLDIELANRAYMDTPLHVAARTNDVISAEMLLDWGAKIDPKNQGGITPLQVAIHNCALETTKYLLQQGAVVHLPWKERNSVDELLDKMVCSRQPEWKTLLNTYSSSFPNLERVNK